jgi:hypothetical protein
MIQINVADYLRIGVERDEDGSSVIGSSSECQTLFVKPLGRGNSRPHRTGEAAGPGLPQAPPVKRDQPLPVPLGGRLVVAPAPREGETVMDAGIEFDLTGGAGPPEYGAEFFDHRQRRQIIVLGASYVELAFDLAQ